MDQFDLEHHDCGDYLNNYASRGRHLGDVVYCRCNQMWALVALKGWRYLKFWRVRDSYIAGTMWYRDKAGEKSTRRAKQWGARA